MHVFIAVCIPFYSVSLDVCAFLDYVLGVSIILNGLHVYTYCACHTYTYTHTFIAYIHIYTTPYIHNKYNIHNMHTYTYIHTNTQTIGIQLSNFLSSPNKAPVIKPWNDATAYPSIYGRTELYGVTFANYGVPCTEGNRGNLSDFGIGVNPRSPDANHPLYVRDAELVDVDDESVARFAKPNPEWINQVCDAFSYDM